MNAMLIIGFVALVALFIFWSAFRNWIGRQLNTIWGFVTLYAPNVANALVGAFNWIRTAVGVYAFILLCTAIVALILMAFALLIHWPTGSAFLFVLAICLVILAWLPAGIILRVFKVTDAVVPQALKALIAWIAFLGWLCLMSPDVITMKSLLGAALFGFIFFGSAFKTKAIDKLIIPLVVVMCLWTAWSYFWPESFRSMTRYTESWAKRIQTAKDRGSIDHEMNAATTYGLVLENVYVTYSLSEDTVLEEHADTLLTGTTVKIANHKREVKVIDGQGFVQIIKAKKNGSYVGGRKVWIEAEYVQLATPRELIPENDDLLKRKKVVNKSTSVRDSIFTQGTYYIDVNGVTPFNIVVHPTKTGCARYNMSSDDYNYKISYFGGGVVKDGPNVVYPYFAIPKFQLISSTNEQVKLVVS
ncbi:MAG: hypothetical protein ACYC40_03160 [Patescibacteria group bacterium]